jgi:hypothetical protein
MLYTVVMEYRGGTYVSQVNAGNVVEALREWALALDTGAIKWLGPARKRELLKTIDEEPSWAIEPVKLDGLVNAWCMSALVPSQCPRCG